MSALNVSSLSAGVQDLFKTGLLPSSLSTSTLNSSSAGQLSQLAASTIASTEASTLFGYSNGSSSTDSATLSSTAANSLSEAVSNELTYNLNAAVGKFDPHSFTTTANQINVLG